MMKGYSLYACSSKQFFSIFTWTLLLTVVLVLGKIPALADGVSGVSISVSTPTVTVGTGQAATFSASVVNAGTPQPSAECKVTGGPYYLWTISKGSVSPNNQATTTASVNYDTPGSNTVMITCTVSYSTDNCSTLSGSDSKPVTINVIGASIDALPNRIPVGRNIAANYKTVNVTLTPSPLPPGVSVIVVLTSTAGYGGAAFTDGSTSKSITQSGSVIIKGTSNSSEINNIKLSAKYSNIELAFRTTTVSTWPKNLTNSLLETGLGFGLKVSVQWESESGEIADLGNVGIREYVTADAMAPNPPFKVMAIQPGQGAIITPDPPARGSCGILDDSHFALVTWLVYDHKSTGVESLTQLYEFKDDVLNTSWQDGILATYSIKHEVYYDSNGIFHLKTSKTGPGLTNAVSDESYVF